MPQPVSALIFRGEKFLVNPGVPPTSKTLCCESPEASSTSKSENVFVNLGCPLYFNEERRFADPGIPSTSKMKNCLSTLRNASKLNKQMVLCNPVGAFYLKNARFFCEPCGGLSFENTRCFTKPWDALNLQNLQVPVVNQGAPYTSKTLILVNAMLL